MGQAVLLVLRKKMWQLDLERCLLHVHRVELFLSSYSNKACFSALILNARQKDPHFCWAFFPSSNLSEYTLIEPLWPEYLMTIYDHLQYCSINL